MNVESSSIIKSTIRDEEKKVTLIKSLFEHRPPSVFFDYKFLNERRFRSGFCFTEKQDSIHLTYSCSWERNCIKYAFKEAGFNRSKNKRHQCCDWIKPPAPDYYKNLTGDSKVNHFPGSWCLGRKDRLLKCLQRAKRFSSSSLVKEKNVYNFFADGWKLPQDFHLWRTIAKRERNTIFILKPYASSRGRGIKLIHRNNKSNVSPKKPCIIQRYINDPYLINEKKFDLRLYVLVTSFDPLKVYLFQDGLVRFSSDKISPNFAFGFHQYTNSTKKLENRFVHFTNYSINKKSKSYCHPKDDTEYCLLYDKCGLDALWAHLHQHHSMEVVQKCKHDIQDVLVKTLIASETEINSSLKCLTRHSKSCFELFGFDILIDKNLKPWLIECNVAPSLMGSSTLDSLIKGRLISDTLHLVGIFSKDAFPVAAQSKKKKSSTTKFYGKNSNDFDDYENDINPDSFSQHHWDMIKDFEDEHARIGHFFCIFPSYNPNYLKLFQTQRVSNKILHAWLRAGRNSYRKSQEILENGCHSKRSILIEKANRKSIFFMSEGKKKTPFVPGFNCDSARIKLEPLESWSDAYLKQKNLNNKRT